MRENLTALINTQGIIFTAEWWRDEENNQSMSVKTPIFCGLPQHAHEGQKTPAIIMTLFIYLFIFIHSV